MPMRAAKLARQNNFLSMSSPLFDLLQSLTLLSGSTRFVGGFIAIVFSICDKVQLLATGPQAELHVCKAIYTFSLFTG